MRFDELYAQHSLWSVTMAEAAEMLGVRKGCFDSDAIGMRCLARLGRPSDRPLPVDEALRLVTLYEP